MKNILTIAICALGFSCYAQSTIGSVNSGAVSANNLIYTVGEIYVLPANPNEANSGIPGIINQLKLTTTGVNEIIEVLNLKVYPNPATNTLFIETGATTVQQLYIYGLDGTLVSTQTVNGNSASLATLQAGTYIIATDLQKQHSFKIIKQ